jgi:hypothetical protein
MPAHFALRFLIGIVALAILAIFVLASDAMTDAVLGRYRMPVGTSSVGIGTATVDRTDPVAMSVTVPVWSLASDVVPALGSISARARLVVGQEIVVIGVAETPAGSTGTIVAVDDPAAPRWIQVVTDVVSQDWMPVESGLPM